MSAAIPRLVLVVMGVSGAGKSTIARAMNETLHWPFQEGDDLHPPRNIEKMKAGTPLDDADRAPWVAACAAWITARLDAREPGLITCSALKRRYRDTLLGGRTGARLLYLHADPALLEARLQKRTGHFMPPSLLASQLATLEPPAADEHPIIVDVAGTVAETVARALAALASAQEPAPDSTGASR